MQIKYNQRLCTIIIFLNSAIISVQHFVRQSLNIWPLKYNKKISENKKSSLVYFCIYSIKHKQVQFTPGLSRHCRFGSFFCPVLRAPAGSRQVQDGEEDSRNLYNHNIGPSPCYPNLKQGRVHWDPYRGALCVHWYFHHRQFSTQCAGYGQQRSSWIRISFEFMTKVFIDKK